VGRARPEHARRRSPGPPAPLRQALFPREVRRGRQDRLESGYLRPQLAAAPDPVAGGDRGLRLRPVRARQDRGFHLEGQGRFDAAVLRSPGLVQRRSKGRGEKRPRGRGRDVASPGFHDPLRRRRSRRRPARRRPRGHRQVQRRPDAPAPEIRDALRIFRPPGKEERRSPGVRPRAEFHVPRLLYDPGRDQGEQPAGRKPPPRRREVLGPGHGRRLSGLLPRAGPGRSLENRPPPPVSRYPGRLEHRTGLRRGEGVLRPGVRPGPPGARILPGRDRQRRRHARTGHPASRLQQPRLGRHRPGRLRPAAPGPRGRDQPPGRQRGAGSVPDRAGRGPGSAREPPSGLHRRGRPLARIRPLSRRSGRQSAGFRAAHRLRSGAARERAAARVARSPHGLDPEPQGQGPRQGDARRAGERPPGDRRRAGRHVRLGARTQGRTGVGRGIRSQARSGRERPCAGDRPRHGPVPPLELHPGHRPLRRAIRTAVRETDVLRSRSSGRPWTGRSATS